MRATPPIEAIVRTIVDGVHPRRVVLFGSHARGEAGPYSDVDLMVEMDTQLKSLERDRPIKELFEGRHFDMDLVVCTPGEFEALEDLKVIDILVAAESVPWAATWFHGQQAAEKLLKALLIGRWVRPDRTHNLTEILEACRKAGDPLMGLDADCALLSTYAVDSRYSWDGFDRPPLPEVAEPDGRAAVSAMRRIVSAVQLVIPSEARDLLFTPAGKPHPQSPDASARGSTPC